MPRSVLFKDHFTDLSKWEQLMTYKTPKMQVVEDPWLALTHRSIQLAVALYGITQIFYRHSFLEIGTPTGSSNMYLSGAPNFLAAEDTALCSTVLASTAEEDDRLGKPLYASNVADYDCGGGWLYENNMCMDMIEAEVVSSSAVQQFSSSAVQ